jgi:hypothetical protein
MEVHRLAASHTASRDEHGRMGGRMPWHTWASDTSTALLGSGSSYGLSIYEVAKVTRRLHIRTGEVEITSEGRTTAWNVALEHGVLRPASHACTYDARRGHPFADIRVGLRRVASARSRSRRVQFHIHRRGETWVGYRVERHAPAFMSVAKPESLNG